MAVQENEGYQAPKRNKIVVQISDLNFKCYNCRNKSHFDWECLKPKNVYLRIIYFVLMLALKY